MKIPLSKPHIEGRRGDNTSGKEQIEESEKKPRKKLILLQSLHPDPERQPTTITL